jgi:hypothetical protein
MLRNVLLFFWINPNLKLSASRTDWERLKGSEGVH